MTKGKIRENEEKSLPLLLKIASLLSVNGGARSGCGCDRPARQLECRSQAQVGLHVVKIASLGLAYEIFNQRQGQRHEFSHAVLVPKQRAGNHLWVKDRTHFCG